MNSIRLEKRLARRARCLKPSPIREIFPLLSIPGMISFGGGYPNPKTFPLERMDLFFQQGKRIPMDGTRMEGALQYGPTDAAPALSPLLLEWHKFKDNIELSKDSLVVLNGAQEGIFIAAYLFLDSGDSVVVSEPTYPGAIAAFRTFTEHFKAVPLDASGMDTNALDAALNGMRARGEPLPKLVYSVPNGHNPAGVALSLERRRHMLEIASRYDVLLLEDDPYQLLRLGEAPHLPSLQSMDREGRVIRLDSFSKILAPGLRLGYASGPSEIMRQFILFKQSANLHTSTLVQAVAAAYLEARGPAAFMDAIQEKCLLYRQNRDAMVEAAKGILPPTVKFNIPGEGMFIWFRLPDSCDAARMIAEDSRDLQVVLVPGSAFSTKGECRSCMRASFSMVDGERIREGMRRFAEMIQREEVRRQPG